MDDALKRTLMHGGHALQQDDHVEIVCVLLLEDRRMHGYAEGAACLVCGEEA